MKHRGVAILRDEFHALQYAAEGDPDVTYMATGPFQELEEPVITAFRGHPVTLLATQEDAPRWSAIAKYYGLQCIVIDE